MTGPKGPGSGPTDEDPPELELGDSLPADPGSEEPTLYSTSTGSPSEGSAAASI